MDIERYTYKVSLEFPQYEFESIGPKGMIRKVVRFIEMDESNNIYNLAFGDLDEKTGEMNDFIVSNNNDREKVLATDTVMDFTNEHPEALVFATGSTPSRTRLYRMGISQHWKKINAIFYVWGFIEDYWEPYQPNKAYRAFLVKRQ